jgi:hypothetical protein
VEEGVHESTCVREKKKEGRKGEGGREKREEGGSLQSRPTFPILGGDNLVGAWKPVQYLY